MLYKGNANVLAASHSLINMSAMYAHYTPIKGDHSLKQFDLGMRPTRRLFIFVVRNIYVTNKA